VTRKSNATCEKVLPADENSRAEHFGVAELPSRQESGEATCTTVRALVQKGVLGGGVLATADCRRTYEELRARGVEFPQPPTERPYGIEALLKDDSGNWFSMTQRTS
jgi:Glyoxalase/Bleomycin resistance protein/Dioxygenase superfamily